MILDYILVGQGISGTWLSYYLQKEKKSFVVIDNNQSNSPSRIAAGIINPVTGRRIVKTWMIDELTRFLIPAYKELGSVLGIKAIQQTTLTDFHPTPQMKIAFDERVNEQADFLSLPGKEKEYQEIFNYDFGFGNVAPCFLINLKEIIPAWRKKMQADDMLLEENFEEAALKQTSAGVQYKNFQAEKIIFCDGINSTTLSFFKSLPFAPNKGEALIIESKDIPHDKIFKKGMMLAPLSANHFWLGSNYLWNFDDDKPTDTFRKQTEAFLKSWLKVPFKIIDHYASIRPANIERRPFVGFHPVYKNSGLLNGMGTKGCSLAPYFAKQLADHMIYGKEILPEADINRFSKILQR
jgi:glycine/D-amino acid oxidase-like deaminating enzyme